MRLPQMIVTTVAAIAFGYVGSQYLNKNIMYTIGGGMVGLSAMTYLVEPKAKEKPINTRSKSSV